MIYLGIRRSVLSVRQTFLFVGILTLRVKSLTAEKCSAITSFLRSESICTVITGTFHPGEFRCISGTALSLSKAIFTSAKLFLALRLEVTPPNRSHTVFRQRKTYAALLPG